MSWLKPRFARRGRLTAGGGRLSGVNVADNDHVDVHLLFTVDVVSKLRDVVAMTLPESSRLAGRLTP